MTGRHGRNQDGQAHLQAAADLEATATATVIAGLRWRLRRQETLEHPKVLCELRKLEEQVTEQLGYTDLNPGRHRSPSGKIISQQIDDAAGFELKPDPLTATSPAEFMEALRQYKFWSGNPSWRKMAKRAGQAVVHSTMYAAMNSDVLPKFDVVKAIIIGCGGGEDDLSAFASAWRRIAPGRNGSANYLGAPIAASLARARCHQTGAGLDDFGSVCLRYTVLGEMSVTFRGVEIELSWGKQRSHGPGYWSRAWPREAAPEALVSRADSVTELSAIGARAPMYPVVARLTPHPRSES